MIRWLDALSLFKWPSLLLCAAPIVAYPFWSPQAEPAERCEPVVVEGRWFVPYRAASGDEYTLRPVRPGSGYARTIQLTGKPRFDSGGMVVERGSLDRAGVVCGG